METPTVPGLTEVTEALGEWQHDHLPFQLHPGDVGWFARYGEQATADALRTWRRGGRVAAVGLLDGPGLVRLTAAPDLLQDEELTRRLVADLSDLQQGILPAGPASVEAPSGSLVHDLLGECGWVTTEAWTPLRRDLADPVEPSGLRTEVVDSRTAVQYADVLRAAFRGSTFSASRWRAMSTAVTAAGSRSLVAYDDADNAVAAITVWSAGPGRPGIIEPLGGHPDHRGHGHGRAMVLAGAAALRELGASSAAVATPSSNIAAVATYASAGFDSLPQRHDRSRPEPSDSSRPVAPRAAQGS